MYTVHYVELFTDHYAVIDGRSRREIVSDAKLYRTQAEVTSWQHNEGSFRTLNLPVSRRRLDTTDVYRKERKKEELTRDWVDVLRKAIMAARRRNQSS